MKTFDDIEFLPHPHAAEGVQGTLLLENGLKLSVVAGPTFYSGAGTYEIALFEGNGEFVPLSPFDDVQGWMTPDEITFLLEDVQKDARGFMERKVQERQEVRPLADHKDLD